MPMRPTWRPWSGSSAASQPAWSSEWSRTAGHDALERSSSDAQVPRSTLGRGGTGPPCAGTADRRHARQTAGARLGSLVSPVRFVAVPLLDPLPHGTAAAFATDAATSVTVCDGPPDGPIAVVKLPGGPTLLPSGPAFLPDAKRVVDLLDSVSALAREVEEAERTPTHG
jgi:hypothetical protein